MTFLELCFGGVPGGVILGFLAIFGDFWAFLGHFGGPRKVRKNVIFGPFWVFGPIGARAKKAGFGKRRGNTRFWAIFLHGRAGPLFGPFLAFLGVSAPFWPLSAFFGFFSFLDAKS